MGFGRQLTGRSAAKDARRAGEIQSAAAKEAGELGAAAFERAGGIEADAFTQAANLQSQAALQAAEIDRLAQLEASGLMSGAQRESLDLLRNQFAETQAQFQGISSQLQPFQQEELAGLQRQQQTLSGQAGLAMGAQQQLGGLLGFQGQEAQQQAIEGVVESPAQQALRERAAKLTARSSAAIGGLGGGNVRSALTERLADIDRQAVNQRISQLGGLSQLGTQGIGLGATGLGVGATGQGAQMGSLQTQQIAQGLQGLGQIQGQGALGAAQARQRGVLGSAGALAGGQLGASQALAGGIRGGAQSRIQALTGAAGAEASGLLGGAQARAQGTQNLLGLGGQLGAAALMSDVRLKTNIDHVGTHNGHNVYEYNYVWGGPRYRGVMAQEVMKINPDAVVEIDGYLAVNYGAL